MSDSDHSSGDESGIGRKRTSAQAAIEVPFVEKKGADVLNQSDFMDLLRIYYRLLFPFKSMFRWLSYGDVGLFSRREFSMTLPGDVYIRYLNYSSMDKFKDDILARSPEKIDIGAVYSEPPANHKALASGFRPVERELVFDIDMTDYDPIRTCCQGAAICEKCWQWMAAAIKVLDHVLREDFGFENLLWVFSGRRGVHCWVCDTAARRLTQEQRSAVADYLHLFTTGDNRHLLQKGRAFPFIRTMIDTYLEPIFRERLVPEQLFLDDRAKAEPILGMIPDEGVQNEIRYSLFSPESKKSREKGAQRWATFRAELEKGVKKATGAMQQALLSCRDEIVLWYTYPRLDINVSKGLNHLLKSPFCVHPKTGKVCIPLDPETCESFDPVNDPPTVYSLIKEYNDFNEHNESSSRKDYKKTSIESHVRFFKNRFVKPLLRAIGKEKGASTAMEE